MKTTTTFDRIYIIESLRDQDRKTGAELYHWLQTLVAGGRGPNICLLTPRTLSNFLSVLEKIRIDTHHLRTGLVIHMEAHGDKLGLQLSSNEIVEWTSISASITRINVAAKNALFLSMAMCEGVFLFNIISPLGRAPFWGLVGPISKLEDHYLADGFKAFYESLATSGNAKTALDRLSAACVGTKYKYSFVNSERLFLLAFDKYVRQHCSRSKARLWARSILKEAGETLTSEQQDNLPPEKALARQLRRDRRTYFHKYATTFFMHDLFPENRKLFSANFEDLKDLRRPPWLRRLRTWFMRFKFAPILFLQS